VNSTLSAPTAVHARSKGPDETRCPGAQKTFASPTRRPARPSRTPRKEIVCARTVALEPAPASVTEHEVPEQDTLLTEEDPAEAVAVAAAEALPPGEPGAPGEPERPGEPEPPGEPAEPGAPEDVLELSEAEQPAQAVSRTSRSTPARTPE
jgi:hypothetical protein